LRFKEIAKKHALVPTFFELCTAAAFLWFKQQAVQVAIIEVGLGGRMDSTNVLEPVATAITNIDLEHTQFLGDTLEAIAADQADNAATAIALALLLAERFPQITFAAIEQGLARVQWPGRLERVSESPPIILDAAHNAAGARMLAENLPPCMIVLALASDKDAA